MNELEPGEAIATAESEAIVGIGPVSSVLAVMVCGVCAFADLYVTQPLLPQLVQIFHVSKSAAGFTVSASTLGVALSAPMFSTYAERLNRKRVIVASILALAVPTLLAATSSNLHALDFWRFLQGVIMPGIFATAIAYVTEEWSEQSVALVMAFYVSGTVLGGFLGRLIAGLITDAYSWRAAFVVLGVINVLSGLLIAMWLPHARRSGHHLAANATHSVSRMEQMLRNFRNPQLLATYAVGFNILFCLVAIFTYVTFHLAAPPFGLSTSQISFLFAVYLAGLVATPAAGVLLTRIELRTGLVAATMLSMLGVLLTLAPSLVWVIIGLGLCSSGVFISQAAAISYLRTAAPLGGRVSAAGLYLSCYYVGGTIAGIVPGYLWRFGGWPACVALTIALQLVTIGIAMVGWKQSRLQTA
ncbi:MAG TPA: MFS transporter [Acidobacteriaceae bacterium]|jgi:predicted MFS family arabinose efflux permease|nr:MFS transporter [Acidobacteriaceae bacterium]